MRFASYSAVCTILVFGENIIFTNWFYLQLRFWISKLSLDIYFQVLDTWISWELPGSLSAYKFARPQCVLERTKNRCAWSTLSQYVFFCCCRGLVDKAVHRGRIYGLTVPVYTAQFVVPSGVCGFSWQYRESRYPTVANGFSLSRSVTVKEPFATVEYGRRRPSQ